MSEFSRKFLRDRFDAGSRPLLGLFGKHPGWDDHIEDLPLPTASMATAKQMLYVAGIGSQISSGAWSRLSEDARLQDFDHAFLWVRGEQFLAGRMWGSRDGKRRAHFPMIAVIHGIAVDRSAALGGVFARLEEVAAGCRAARTADEVRAGALGAWSGERKNELEMGGDERGAAQPCAIPCSTLFAPRSTILQAARAFHEAPPAQTRLPGNADDPIRALIFWSRVSSALAPTEMPLLLLAPLGQSWVDVLAGEPAPAALFCLRAGLAALPWKLTSEDPSEEVDAEDLIKEASGRGGGAAGERNWISRLLRH